MPPYCSKHSTYHGSAGECDYMSHRERAIARAEEIRKRAERIADSIMENMNGTESLHSIATSAALAALNEKGGVR